MLKVVLLCNFEAIQFFFNSGILGMMPNYNIEQKCDTYTRMGDEYQSSTTLLNLVDMYLQINTNDDKIQ